jgi:hypothetical protein
MVGRETRSSCGQTFDSSTHEPQPSILLDTSDNPELETTFKDDLPMF